MEKGYHKGQELTMSEVGLSLEWHYPGSDPLPAFSNGSFLAPAL